jgi:hypothetical protein
MFTNDLDFTFIIAAGVVKYLPRALSLDKYAILEKCEEAGIAITKEVAHEKAKVIANAFIEKYIGLFPGLKQQLEDITPSMAIDEVPHNLIGGQAMEEIEKMSKTPPDAIVISLSALFEQNTYYEVAHTVLARYLYEHWKLGDGEWDEERQTKLTVAKASQDNVSTTDTIMAILGIDSDLKQLVKVTRRDIINKTAHQMFINPRAEEFLESIRLLNPDCDIRIATSMKPEQVKVIAAGLPWLQQLMDEGKVFIDGDEGVPNFNGDRVKFYEYVIQDIPKDQSLWYVGHSPTGYRTINRISRRFTFAVMALNPYAREAAYYGKTAKVIVTQLPLFES